MNQNFQHASITYSNKREFFGVAVMRTVPSSFRESIMSPELINCVGVDVSTNISFLVIHSIVELPTLLPK